MNRGKSSGKESHEQWTIVGRRWLYRNQALHLQWPKSILVARTNKLRIGGTLETEVMKSRGQQKKVMLTWKLSKRGRGKNKGWGCERRKVAWKWGDSASLVSVFRIQQKRKWTNALRNEVQLPRWFAGTACSRLEPRRILKILATHVPVRLLQMPSSVWVVQVVWRNTCFLQSKSDISGFVFAPYASSRNIFSWLDYRSLEASSAAHPLFSDIAERYLYADIVLGRSASVTITQLLNLFSERPHIASRVFSLTIAISSNYSLTYENLEAYPPVISLLQNLRKITIEHPHEFWSILPQSFRLSLETSLRWSSIQELGVTGFIVIPLSLLHNCKGIKILKLKGCIIYDLGDLELNSPHDRSLIKDLSIVDVRGTSLKRLTPWIVKSCKQLRYFQFSSYRSQTLEGDFSLIIAPILTSCSDSLTTLDMDLMSSCRCHATFTSYFIFSELITILARHRSRTPDPKPPFSPSSQRSHFPRQNIWLSRDHRAFYTLFTTHRTSRSYAGPAAAYPPPPYRLDLGYQFAWLFRSRLDFTGFFPCYSWSLSQGCRSVYHQKMVHDRMGRPWYHSPYHEVSEYKKDGRTGHPCHCFATEI